PSQLETALDAQRRSLKRLGDVLVSLKMITPDRFRQMVQLQATETLYKLFTWKSGKYEFEQVPVDVDQDSGIIPIRAESVLMEGFRMVDEWPVIKRTINLYDLTFEKVRDQGRQGRLRRRAGQRLRRQPAGRGRRRALRRPRVQVHRRVGAEGVRAGHPRPRPPQAGGPGVPGRVRDLQGPAQPGQQRLPARGASRGARP